MSRRHSAPLVSCITPTQGRPEYLRQAIRYFQKQDYPHRELVIVDDEADEPAPSFPEDSRIRYYRVKPGLSIGAKRNLACDLARGSIIAHWDDDDWYAADRLSAQVAPILAGEADVTGFHETVFFDLPEWRFWTCTPELHGTLFIRNVHGGTLTYHRRLWERSGPYPDISLAEDAAFLLNGLWLGARLRRLSNEGRFIYLRHLTNSWTFTCGAFPNPEGWLPAACPALAEEDLAFYAARRKAAKKKIKKVKPGLKPKDAPGKKYKPPKRMLRGGHDEG